MQLCQIHFHQKIARKKVASVSAALVRFWDFREESESESLCRFLVARISGMWRGDGDLWVLFGILMMRVFWSESRLLRCPL